MIRRALILLAATSFAVFLPEPADARQTQPCLLQQVSLDQGDPYDPANGDFPSGGWGGNSCTANDISIKQVFIGGIIDGCTNTQDTAQVVMSVQVEASGAGGSRYDVGTWLNVSGGSALLGESECVLDIFDPAAIPTEGTNEEGGFGDACNDAAAGAIVTVQIGPVEIQCADNILPTDGVVDFSGCVGWDNNNMRACSGATTGPNIVRPQNSSKCGCSDQSVPGLALPELSVTKSCTPGSIGLNQTATCTVTVTNSSTVAAADFTGFFDEWNPSEIVVSEDIDGPRTWVDGVRADGTTSVVVDNVGGSITWKPGGDPVTVGNIPASPDPGSTTVLTYEVQIADPNNPPGGAINNTVCIWQYDRPNLDDGTPVADVAQGTYPEDEAAGICDQATLNYSPSAAVITDFLVTSTGSGNHVTWETGAEIGTLALQLERRTHKGFVPVGRPIETLIQAPQGATYSVIDPESNPEAVYRIVEIEAGGIERVHRVDQTPQRIARDARRATAQTSVIDLPTRVARKPVREPRRFVEAISQKKGNRGSGSTGASRAIIEVATSGIQQVAATELADVFGLQANAVRSSLRTGRFSLHREGAEVTWWTDQGATALYFHGTALDNIDSRVTAYRLDLEDGASPNTVQAKSSGGAATALWHETRFEENNFPNLALVQDPEVDFWFWGIAGRSGSSTLEFDLDQAQTGSEAELDFEFYGYGVEPGAAITAELNGQAIGTVAVGAAGVGKATFHAPAGVLQAGTNTATFSNNGGFIATGADALSVRYVRHLTDVDGLDFLLDAPTSVRLEGVSSGASLVALDTSGGATTLYRGLDTRAGGIEVDLPAGRFIVAESFQAPAVRAAEGDLDPQAQAADLIIVAHPTLLDGAQAFADYRAQQGLDVVVKSTTEVFDEYGNSEFGPDAIRRFAQETYDASGGGLQGLFLIGSGTFDGRSLRGFDRSLVPTKLTAVSWGILSSDRWFADFDGNGTDEIAVGRLPAGTNEQVLAYLSRVQYFEVGGSWAQQDVLLADNGDGAGNFPADSDLLVPVLRNPERIYLGQTHSLAAARTDLLDAWSEGRRIINYYGHGGIVAAAHEGLLSIADLSSLDGAASNPLFLGTTCNIARFDLPGFPSLGEEMVLADDGAIAVWAAAGLSTHDSVVGLSGNVVNLLGGQRLGEAVRQVTAAAGSVANEPRLTLLGDPMIQVP